MITIIPKKYDVVVWAVGPQRHKAGKTMDSQPAILFYDKSAPYYEFSNFYPVKKLFIDGDQYLSTEHYFQAEKFNYPDAEFYRDIIILADSPMKVKMLGSQNPTHRFGQNWVVNKHIDLGRVVDVINQNKKLKIRPDWDNVRVDVMKKALKYKFKNADLEELLLETDDKQLIENSPNDLFWGNGYRSGGNGQNMLGKLLMELRESIKSLK